VFDDRGEVSNAYVLDALSTAPDHNEPWKTLLDRGLVGFVYHAQRIVHIRNVETDPRWQGVPNLPQSGSAIGLPLYRDRMMIGVMMFLHPEVDFFDHRITAT